MIEYIKNLDPKVIAAIVAAITSIVTLLLTLLTKNWIQKTFHRSKLELDHNYEQKKQVKNVLSKYKGPLLKSASSLHGRLKNLTKNKDARWHYLNGEYSQENKYYFKSFIYRILRFYAWIKIVEDELIYLDTVIATTEDLEFVKFLRMFPMAFSDGDLVEGIENDRSKIEKDIIYRDVFHQMYNWMITEDKKVISYEMFCDQMGHKMNVIKPICEFIDSVSPNEDRLRWDRLFILQTLLVGFLNKYGYDFDYTSKEYLEQLLTRQGKTITFKNLDKHLFQKFKLKKTKEIKEILQVIKEYDG